MQNYCEQNNPATRKEDLEDFDTPEKICTVIDIVPFTTIALLPEISQRLLYEKCLADKPSNFIMVFDVDYCLYRGENCLKAEFEHIKVLEKSLLSELNIEINRCDIMPTTFKEIKAEFDSVVQNIFSILYGKDMNFLHSQGFHDAHIYLEKDEELVEALNGLPFDKYCFTNGLRKRVEPILDKLEVKGFFKGVFSPDENLFKNKARITKPKAEAYRFVEYYLKPDKNTKIVFFDDVEENIKMAESEEFQWISFLVTPENSLLSRIKEFKEHYMKTDR